MAETTTHAPFPRWFLVGTAMLMLSAVGVAAVARFTGHGVSRVEQTAVAASINIWFEEQADKTVLVRQAGDNRILEILPADGSGFVRGVSRSLMRQRLLAHADGHAPFQLSQRENAQFFIVDTLSGVRMELEGFGPTNTQAFANLFKTGHDGRIVGHAVTTQGVAN